MEASHRRGPDNLRMTADVDSNKHFRLPEREPLSITRQTCGLPTPLNPRYCHRHEEFVRPRFHGQMQA